MTGLRIIAVRTYVPLQLAWNRGAMLSGNSNNLRGTLTDSMHLVHFAPLGQSQLSKLLHRLLLVGGG